MWSLPVCATRCVVPKLECAPTQHHHVRLAFACGRLLAGLGRGPPEFTHSRLCHTMSIDDVDQSVEWDGMSGPRVPPDHCLGGAQRIDDRLFIGIGDGMEQTIH